jgi:hypothetical protein
LILLKEKATEALVIRDSTGETTLRSFGNRLKHSRKKTRFLKKNWRGIRKLGTPFIVA